VLAQGHTFQLALGGRSFVEHILGVLVAATILAAFGQLGVAGRF
jgi:hypothetical protein